MHRCRVLLLCLLMLGGCAKPYFKVAEPLLYPCGEVFEQLKGGKCRRVGFAPTGQQDEFWVECRCPPQLPLPLPEPSPSNPVGWAYPRPPAICGYDVCCPGPNCPEE